MSALVVSKPAAPAKPVPARWAGIDAAAPVMAATMLAYLGRLSAELSAASVAAAEVTLRQFAGHVIATDPTCRSVAATGAEHVAAYRAELGQRWASSGERRVLSTTVDYRVATLHRFFGQIAAWGFADTPAVTPVGAGLARPGRPRRRGGGRPAKALAKKPGPRPERPAQATWAEISRRAPRLASTMTGYLDQLAISHRPASVRGASQALRLFARHLIVSGPACTAVADIDRRHIEGYKVALAAQKGPQGKPLSAQTVRNRLGQLRSFFERLIDWDDPDKPRRVPVFAGDLSKADDPLPKFLDDPSAAKFMAALATEPDRRRRLMVELLARTGMRVGELAALRDDATYRVGATYWLRVPVGKLHNDRNVPLHPLLLGLITDYRTWRGPSSSGLLFERSDHQPLDRYVVARAVERTARRAGVGHVHPHQLRHTLATQCLNRGMSLEAIAALLGHRTPRMTLVYARISDTNVAEQYFRATDAVETKSASAPGGHVDAKPQARAHQRLLGNGHCTRPLELDCRFQTICEGCGFFDTNIEFIDILRRQRDDAVGHSDAKRTRLYNELVEVIASGP